MELIASISYPALFAVAFSPILGAISLVLLWRAWVHINKSQR